MTPRFIIIDDGFPPREVSPKAETFDIGRDAERDVFLHHATVSRRHAVIWRKHRRIFLEDAGSRYGTFVNHRPVPGGTLVPLADGDVLQLGDVRIVCRLPAETVRQSSDDGAFAARSNARVILLEEGRVERIPLSRIESRVGCGPHCEVTIDGVSGEPLEQALIQTSNGAYRMQSRSKSDPPRFDEKDIPMREWVSLPSHSAVGLHRSQILFLYDFDAEGAAVEDPLNRMSRRALVRSIAARIGIKRRALKKLIKESTAIGMHFAELLVVRRLLTPISWRAIYVKLLEEL